MDNEPTLNLPHRDPCFPKCDACFEADLAHLLASIAECFSARSFERWKITARRVPPAND